MYDRRTVLATSGALLTGIAGCLSTDDDPGTGSGTPTDAPTERPESETATDDQTTGESTTEEDAREPPTWEHQWYEGWDYDNALGVDPYEGTAYVTLSDEGDGYSATVAVDPADGTTLWQTEHEGEAVGRSYVMHNEGDDQWGVTVTGDTVFSVNGLSDQFEWTTLHAMNRETGERRWTLRRERLLGVVGVTDGTVFVLATDFFEPEHSHDEPDPRPTSVLAVDATTGDVRWEQTVTAAEADAAADAEGVYFVADDRLLVFGHDGTKRAERALATTGGELAVADGGRYLFERGETVARVSGVAPDGSERWAREADSHHHLAVGDVLYLDRPTVSAVGADGSIHWQAEFRGGDFLAGPDGDRLYARAGRHADAVTAFAAADGTPQWTFDPPYDNAWPAAATAGTAVVEALAGHGYSLYAVDAGTGDLLARLEGVQSFAIEGVGDRVLVADGSGGLRALPARP
ncbi:outer membrane protein assembly factor BamB family protein [Haloarchaeobius sp. DT45]|uniref:outer membrane protein assembly factor BamB family protein n=1 Tax=Haloarchaeobius sp. DT45 TaxID=3446116 RepID=UPI003F6CAEC6